MVPNDEWVEKPAVYGGETLDHSVKDLYYEASINYARKFGGHDLSVLGVFNRRNYETKRAGNSLVDFPTMKKAGWDVLLIIITIVILQNSMGHILVLRNLLLVSVSAFFRLWQ